ncbi:MAG: error-prone DNA polymerase [Deltaproteobacteria bacterium]|jgi:error-prone DNA polymerase|nr:error-prone DNA polymerase [Deltaproteobacteria bacterium]MBW2534881.1 error-prone DNA polymerase [Deltaproteobacteria bacterium]
MPPFAELLGRSCFSFLEGASHPEELCLRARDLDLDAIALCDRDGLYGSVRMHQAAREHGVRVIVGAELRLERADAVRRGPGSSKRSPAEHGPSPSVALLVESHAGYAALCRLLTIAHAEYDKGDAGITAEAIADDAEGLTAVVPLDPRWPLEDRELDALRQAFGERCAIATWRHLEPIDDDRLRLAERCASRFDLPVVASARPSYHQRCRKPLCDVLYCIRHKTTLDEAGTALSPNGEAELKNAHQLGRLFSTTPSWLAHTVAIAERCQFSLDELSYRFPSEYGAEELSPDETLRRRVERGSIDRFPTGVPPEVRAQLDKELRLIAELQVAPYFLSVQEIVDIARQRGILCQGRGSAANSAVCFVLGITAVDPVRSSLLFERFMSTERREPPDIDVDFEHERREEVIQAIYERYGRDRAAMVSEIIAYRPKSALREVGKAFGLSPDQLERLSSVVSHYGFRDDADGKAPEQVGILPDRALTRRGLDPDNARLRHVIRLAAELEGIPRHLSIHVGGFVLSAEPLCHVAPVEPARMPDRTVIPWDKDDLEALGFFKVDVLGLGMLTAIRKALELLHGTGETDDEPADMARPPFDPIATLAAIPPEDPAAYEAIGRADTVGVFQIESRAQMAMLPILKPRCFYDLVVEVGIVRPGPIQGKMVHPYLRRRTGEEPVTYPHPCLEPILERTLGVPLFQEQVMQIAIEGAGYSGGEADQLRRDMAAWRKHGRLARHRDKLLEGFRRQGIADEFGERLFRQIMGFGEYGFPESHAASFALIVYASAWLKVHHPAAFACALINSQPMGFYSPAAIVRDAQRKRPGAAGVDVRPVRVEQSEWDCTLEPTDDGPPALRLGFRLVRGLARDSAARIVAARPSPPFDGIDDFIHRTGIPRHELELLAEAGALEGIVAERREALWRIRAPRAAGLFGDHSIEPAREAGLPPLAPVEQLALDYGTVGMSLNDHPMRHVRRQHRRRRIRRAAEQRGFRQGQQVTVAGVVQSRQRPMTASGIVFITLEDETGMVNLVVYPSVYEAHELVVRHASIILAQGRVDRRGDVVHVKATRLERIDAPSARPLPLRSRDFR